jgi:DNA repair protein RAD50
MIQFHEERMSTVNKIMGQLWNLVYSGRDTSSIQIRVQTTEGIGDKKRSYNYKLIQVKRGTEMDMKGKCSAGQKVIMNNCLIVDFYIYITSLLNII